MTPHAELTFRRILVALDDAGPNRDALSAAVDLAARLSAHLEGLFVEDVNLLRAAALPFAFEISVPSGALQPVDRCQLEAQLRAAAESARAALAAAAQPYPITWSFRVARGQVSVELLGAARSADLLVVGRRARRAGARPGQTARTAASGAPTSVLVAVHDHDLRLPMAVAYDGSLAADRALDVVRRLSLEGGSAVTLLVSADTEQGASSLADEARLRLAPGPARVQWTGGDRIEDLIRVAQDSRALLVVGADSPLFRSGGLERLLDAIDQPLLVIR